MKFIGVEDSNMNGCRNNDISNTNNNNNWLLGISLSPHLKMQQQQQQQQQQQVNASSDLQFHHDQHHHHQNHQQHGSQLCYADQTNGFHMPLKSDGSLCINPPHTYTRQGMSHESSPKLEDFLGAATMGGDHSNRSLYFHHNAEPVASSISNTSQSSLDFITDQQQNIYLNHHHHLYQNQASEPTHLLQAATIAQMPSTQQWSTTFHQEFEQQMSGKSLVVANGDQLQALTLSMSPGSQLNCVTAQISPTESTSSESKKRGFNDVVQKQPVHRKSLDTFGQRTSQFRGVTRHRWTGRYEAHLWDNSCKKEGQTRKGRQVYLGGYDMEEKAARAYDLAALKYWGPSTHINLSVENYQLEIEEMKKMSRQEYVAHLRRKSSGFSRGASIYRGVTRHHQHGRWQARIGRVAGNKDLYLGTFSTQEEAAEAYDVAAIKFRGVNAVTNFDISIYDAERIIASTILLAGELAKRNCIKESLSTQQAERTENRKEDLSHQSQNAKTILGDEPLVKEAVKTSLGDEPLVKEATSPAKMFPKHPLGSNLSINSSAGWIPSAARHVALTTPNMPVFAAWYN